MCRGTKQSPCSVVPDPESNRKDASIPKQDQAALVAEQENVDKLIATLDQEVAQANARLKAVMLEVDPCNPDAEALVRRETEYHSLNEKIDRLNLAQLGLVFGRIDVADVPEHLIDNPVEGQPGVDRRYIGRMGLMDREDNYRTLLLDWRAPMARPFYLATTAHPEGVQLRRHIRTKGTKVTGVHDEVLSGPGSAEGSGVTSEAALHDALEAARTGHMASIVQTIQREQDQIIRDEHRGVMVVEGGPGTGKTAVALHRIAYLLYTWREQLAKTGVLILGPNATFLEYISRVLPELGETGVVLSTVGDLYPGVEATAEESLLAREIKGSEEMVVLIDRLIKHHQQLPESTRSITIDGLELALEPAMVKAARTRARRSRKPHNEARPAFCTALAEQIANAMRDRIGADPLGGKNLLGEGDLAELHDDVRQAPIFEQLCAEFWPELAPTTVLAEFFEDPSLIRAIAFDYDEDTQQALYRRDGDAWASSDAALLDELAARIGGLDPEEQLEAQRKRWREQVAEAAEALDVLTGSQNTDLDDEADAEILSAHDVVDAETLAARQEVRDQRSTAQRAAEDHRWAFGHVIIDEAQELTPMEWRMVFRRSPSRWMTIVGDPAQTGSPAGVDAWADTLEPYVQDRFHTHRLSVNYRTPVEIMELAHRVLDVYAPHAPKAQALRRSNEPIRYFPEGSDPLAIAREIQQREPERLCAVIGPDALAGEGILGISAAKGLEFDHVVLLDPKAMVEESPQGWQNLYVACTRATQTLSVIGELPL
ncbi:Helicase IV [Corynebacterium pelargi]|uniref:Helicase IV n=1 Tax=Corynebacterium pelargi TaxID=1471400 RepID=A0A410W955_9CORY|nr:Helicase IV [Corynebacterium pelargi]